MWDKIAHNSESSVAELSGEGRYELDGAATASSQLRKQDCVLSEPRVTIWPCVSANINSFLVFCRAVIYHKATHRRHHHHGVMDPGIPAAELDTG